MHIQQLEIGNPQSEMTDALLFLPLVAKGRDPAPERVLWGMGGRENRESARAARPAFSSENLATGRGIRGPRTLNQTRGGRWLATGRSIASLGSAGRRGKAGERNALVDLALARVRVSLHRQNRDVVTLRAVGPEHPEGV